MWGSLQPAVDRLLERTGQQWLTGLDWYIESHKENMEKYAAFILLGIEGKEIKFASDDLNPFWHDDEKIVDALRQCLCWGIKTQIIVHRGNSPKEAVVSIQRTNPNLYSLWCEMRDNLMIYYSPVLLHQPFLVIVGVGVLFEAPLTKESNYRWYGYSAQNKKLAEEWSNRFDSFLTSGRLELIHPP